ncbi:MAG: peroxiredoxin [Planctomycetota bacterium]
MLKVGDKAPDFHVLDHEGRPVSLASFAGQRVLVWFYPKADTPGCTLEGQGFRDRSAQMRAVGEIVGVSFDEPAANKAFVEKHRFPFRLLCDPSKAMSMAYGACADASAKYPDRITYIIDKDGVIEYAEKVTDIAAHVDAATARMCDV